MATIEHSLPADTSQSSVMRIHVTCMVVFVLFPDSRGGGLTELMQCAFQRASPLKQSVIDSISAIIVTITLLLNGHSAYSWVPVAGLETTWLHPRLQSQVRFHTCALLCKLTNVIIRMINYDSVGAASKYADYC